VETTRVANKTKKPGTVVPGFSSRRTIITIELNKPFDIDSHVDAQDARVVKRALNCLGYYTPAKNIGLTDFPDREIFEAIKEFQTDQDIPATGLMRSGGTTINALNENITRKLGGK
jgi:hypothetical protein